MQRFTTHHLRADKVGYEVGYWSMSVKGNRRTYHVSITRDGEDMYTIASSLAMPHEEQPHVRIAGHVTGIVEAVKLANQTIEQLQKHDLYVTIRNSNGVGSQVLISR